MKRVFVLTMTAALLLIMTSCSDTDVPAASASASVITSESTTSAVTVIETETEASVSDTTETESSVTETDMVLKINDQVIEVAWESNDSVEALKELASDGEVTIEMTMYGGFEQVGPLGTDLPSDDEQTTTAPGDIVLYSGDQIVVFYGSNTWSYTRLGKIQNMSEEDLTALLGSSDVTITISID